MTLPLTLAKLAGCESSFPESVSMAAATLSILPVGDVRGLFPADEVGLA